MRALSVAVLLTLAAPLAAAVPTGCTAAVVAIACVDDQQTGWPPILGDPPCDGYRIDETAVRLYALVVSARAGGSRSSCSWYGIPLATEEITASASTPAGSAGASWSASSAYGTPYACRTYVYAVVVAQDLGCPAGTPPNPGWGQLLP